MDKKPLKFAVTLKQIDYSGDNIGDDLTFGFDVNGEYTFIDQKISAGKSQVIDKVLFRLPVHEADKISFKVSVVVTEQDMIFDDVGQGTASLSFDATQSAIIYGFQVNVKERNNTATFSFKIEAAIKNFDFSRFDKTLTYMYQELIVNAQSKEAQAVHSVLSIRETMLARTAWASLVRTGGKWDHKPILEKKLELKTPPDYWFPIRDDNEHEWSYDIWSNIHYGFVGRSIGFDAQTLHYYAESGYPGAGKSDEGDVLSVQIGIDLWDKYQLALTQEQLHEAIVSHLQDYLNIRQVNPKVNVVIDWVDGNLR